MADVATLKANMAELKQWRVEVDRHDEKQDTALYAVERRQDAFERSLTQMLEEDREHQKKYTARQKAILALAGCSAIDAVGWNLWNHVQPYLEPFMSRQFFWFSISLLGFLFLSYAAFMLAYSARKPRKDNLSEQENSTRPTRTSASAEADTSTEP